MSDQFKEEDPVAALKDKVDLLEKANQNVGYDVPKDALIFLSYPEAKSLLAYIEMVESQ